MELTLNVLLRCPFCGLTHNVNVPFDGYLAWDNGELIQDAMPMLSAVEREQLISHFCPACQKKIFFGGEE